MNINKKQFNCQKLRIMSILFIFMDTTSTKRCITHIEWAQLLSIWTLARIFNTYFVNVNSKEFFGSRWNYKK